MLLTTDILDELVQSGKELVDECNSSPEVLSEMELQFEEVSKTLTIVFSLVNKLLTEHTFDENIDDKLKDVVKETLFNLMKVKEDDFMNFEDFKLFTQTVKKIDSELEKPIFMKFYKELAIMSFETLLISRPDIEFVSEQLEYIKGI